MSYCILKNSIYADYEHNTEKIRYFQLQIFQSLSNSNLNFKTVVIINNILLLIYKI